jgi:hypothetical protein
VFSAQLSHTCQFEAFEEECSKQISGTLFENNSSKNIPSIKEQRMS